MKVIYILDVFPKISETFILNEILEMQKKGIEIEVFAFSKANEDKVHSKVSDIKKIRYDYGYKIIEELQCHLYLLLTRPKNYIKTLIFSLDWKRGVLKLFISRASFMRLIANAKPNHIHAHFGHRSSDVAMLIYLLYDIPFTFTTHGYDIFVNPSRNYRIKSSLAKKHVTISEYNKKYMIDRFDVEENKIRVIHCGVDFRRKFPPQHSCDENIILSVARLDKLKGLDILIKTCAELRKRQVRFQCIIAGEGPERSSLEHLITQYSLDSHVKLLGNKTQDEIFELLSIACINVLPSRSESMGVSLMEAMSMMVPVIGPNIYGVPELVEDGTSGFLIEPNNVDVLTNRIETMLYNDGLRRKFAENGYKKVFSDFNLETETNKLLKLWKH